MDRNEATSVIQRFLTCRDICRDECYGYCETCRYNTEYDEMTEALKLAIKALEGKDTNVPTWIPFTAETMPKEDGEYFVLYDDEYAEDYDTGRVGVADFYVDCEAFGYWQERYDPVTLGFVDSDFVEIKVKKWMPIPEEEGEQHDSVD